MQFTALHELSRTPPNKSLQATKGWSPSQLLATRGESQRAGCGLAAEAGYSAVGLGAGRRCDRQSCSGDRVGGRPALYGPKGGSRVPQRAQVVGCAPLSPSVTELLGVPLSAERSPRGEERGLLLPRAVIVVDDRVQACPGADVEAQIHVAVYAFASR